MIAQVDIDRRRDAARRGAAQRAELPARGLNLHCKSIVNKLPAAPRDRR